MYRPSDEIEGAQLSLFPGWPSGERETISTRFVARSPTKTSLQL
jgi:hypothetical protein